MAEHFDAADDCQVEGLVFTREGLISELLYNRKNCQ